MSGSLAPSAPTLARLAALGVDVDVPAGLSDDVLRTLPAVLWLLERTRSDAIVAEGATLALLEGLLALPDAVPSGGAGVGITELTGDREDGRLRIAGVLSALEEGALEAAVLVGPRSTGDDLAAPANGPTVHVDLQHDDAGGPARLVGPAGRGPVAELAALPAEELDRWARLHALLGAGLVAERHAGGAGLRDELLGAYAQLDEVLTSPSWRLTAPLRTFVRQYPTAARTARSAARAVLTVLSRDPARTRRGRVDRYGHAETAVALAQDLAVRTTGSLQRVKEEGHVGWVASVGDPFTTRYRVSNLSAALRQHGVRSTVVASDGLDAGLLASCGTVVLCRVAWDDEVARQVERLRESGTRIVFDIDDLAFDPTRVALTHPPAGREAYRRHLFARHRATLLEADAVTVSTAPLRAEVAALGRPAAVVPNNLGIDVLERWARGPRSREERVPAPQGARTGGEVRFVYLSGTATHAYDVREMTSALAAVMRGDDRIELHVVGPVDLPAELEGLRVVRHPLQRYHDMLALLSTMDVNLAPLELGNAFTDAKSELKVFEAACVGVPTIASPTRPYAATVEHGRTGMLAAESAEWTDAISALATDPELRDRLGAEASATIVPRFAAPAVAEVAATVLGSIARCDRLSVAAAPGDAGEGLLGLLLPAGAVWSELRELVVGLSQGPDAGRCVLLVDSGDPSTVLLRELLAALAHGPADAGVPGLVTLLSGPSSPPAARAAAAISGSGCSALAVLPEGTILASDAVTAALGAFERHRASVVVGTLADEVGSVPTLRQLMLDADLAARPGDHVVRDLGGPTLGSIPLPVLDRRWAAEHLPVLAALVAGERPERVISTLIAEGIEVLSAPGLRGSTRGVGR